jgi:hypothetical protein
MAANLTLIAPLAALAFGALALGGGVYETVLVDRVWPGNPAVIQPRRGGLNRGVFWILAHPPFELALLVSLWLAWGYPSARGWLIAALAVHLASRAWAFSYFIPNARRFETMGDLTDAQRAQADRWVRLSRVRPFITIVSIVALGVAILALARST